MILDAYEPRVRFGSGSETNIWLGVEFDGTMPRFTRVPGSVDPLCNPAHLGEHLESISIYYR